MPPLRQIPYTYTYDQFTVFFYSNRVFIGENDFPIGQCCVDIMNLDEQVLRAIDRRVREFVPATQALLAEKTNTAAASVQEKLSAVWDVVFTLPVYREVKMDVEISYHAFGRLLADRKSGYRYKTRLQMVIMPIEE